MIDEKKRNSMQEMIKANVNGEQNQNEVWKLYTEALDMEKIGQRHPINPSQQQGSPRTTNGQTQQPGSTREPRRPGRPPRNPQQPPTQS